MFLERVLFPAICFGINVFTGSSAEEVEVRVVGADKGRNVTIPCGGMLTLPPPNVLWVHRGNRTHHEILDVSPRVFDETPAPVAIESVVTLMPTSTGQECCHVVVVNKTPGIVYNSRTKYPRYSPGESHYCSHKDGSLLLTQVDVDDAGLYECGVENETAFIDRVNLTIRTEPPPLVNVTVHASTILALILWNVAGDGGHPIIDFTAQYRSAAPVNGSLEPWRPISPNHISPNSRQIDVYHLDTNASYWFRVWATNVLGPGPPVEVLGTTLYVDQEAELYKHFLEGAETFDTRTWVAAVCVVMGTLVVLAAGTCAVLCREWRRSEYGDEQDVIELVPNIILNPGFMETDPVRPRESYAASIIKSAECPGPGKPRRV